jgi:hypothetical protein
MPAEAPAQAELRQLRAEIAELKTLLMQRR